MKHWYKYSCPVSCGLILMGLLGVHPAAAGVVLSFTGTVTDVGSIAVSPPSGVAVNDPVSGTVTYDPAEATMVEVGPSERAYVFLPGTGNQISITIGAHVWTADLQAVAVCDEVCDGDYLNFAALSNTTENFPDNLGTGFLLVEFSDSEAPYDLGNGHDLPNAAEDVDFAAAVTKSGAVQSNGGIGFWSIVFDVESPTVPVTNSTWGEVKALYSKP